MSAIFEAGIRTGTRVPTRTTFEFNESPTWIQNSAEYKEPSIVADSIVLNSNLASPRMDATVHNLSLETIQTLGVVAVVYDAEDNAIAASRTVVEGLSAQNSAQVSFTWPAPFPSPAVRKEIVLEIYPAGVAF